MAWIIAGFTSLFANGQRESSIPISFLTSSKRSRVGSARLIPCTLTLIAICISRGPTPICCRASLPRCSRGVMWRSRCCRSSSRSFSISRERHCPLALRLGWMSSSCRMVRLPRLPACSIAIVVTEGCHTCPWVRRMRQRIGPTVDPCTRRSSSGIFSSAIAGVAADSSQALICWSGHAASLQTISVTRIRSTVLPERCELTASRLRTVLLTHTWGRLMRRISSILFGAMTSRARIS